MRIKTSNPTTDMRFLGESTAMSITMYVNSAAVTANFRTLKRQQLQVTCKTIINMDMVGWFVGFGLNDPLRQYFSLYRVVYKREEQRGEKG